MTTKFCLSNSSILTLFLFVTRTLATLDNFEITSQDIAEFQKKIELKQVGDVNLPLATQELNLKEHILLVMNQYAAIYEGVHANYKQLVCLKYLKFFPEVVKACPGLEKHIEYSEKVFLESIPKETAKPRLSITQQKITNTLDELGVFYRVSERVGDVMKAQIYLPNENTIIEHVQLIDYIKTEHTTEDKLYGARYTMRQRFLTKLGYKLVTIDSYEMIATEGSHLKLIDLIKAKLGMETKSS